MVDDISRADRSGALGHVRSLWHKLPEGMRHSFWQAAGPGLQRAYALSQLARPSKLAPPIHTAPLVVAGLFSTANGIGEAARSTYRSLEAAGLSPVAVDLSEHLAPVDMQSPIPCQPMPSDERGTLILQLNGPETSSALEHLKMTKRRDWFTIGYWAWELPVFPETWQKAFPFLSELWAISTFTADALRQHPKTPLIQVFPHAVSPPKVGAANRAQFDLSEDAYVFLVMADSMSSLQRKNPFAAIRAFREAFGIRIDRHLVVKTRNLQRDPRCRADLEAAISDAPNISILNASLSEQERWELMHTVDSFISLHRSEGFGLVLAEAMSVGKPVMTTNWSGNMDFTDETNAVLIESDLVACDDDYGIYTSKEAVWANVRHDEVVKAMRRLADDYDYASQVAVAGQARMRDWANVSVIGERMKARLVAVSAENEK